MTKFAYLLLFLTYLTDRTIAKNIFRIFVIDMNIQSSKPLFVTKLRDYRNVDDYLIRGGAPSVRDLIRLKNEGVTQIYDFRHDSRRGLKFIEVCRLGFLPQLMLFL